MNLIRRGLLFLCLLTSLSTVNGCTHSNRGQPSAAGTVDEPTADSTHNGNGQPSAAGTVDEPTADSTPNGNEQPSAASTVDEPFAIVDLPSHWARVLSKSLLAVPPRHRPRSKQFHRESGLVPDRETAVAIAIAVWNPIYGVDRIRRQAPYQVAQVDNYWVVSGSLPEGHHGGTAECLISRRTGEILSISHSR